MRIDNRAGVPSGRRAAGLTFEVVVLLSTVSVVASCDAKSPLDPSATVPVDRVELQLGDRFGSTIELENGIPVFYSIPTLGGGFTVTVYAIDDDGVYKNVTGQATLSSNDPAVGRPVRADSSTASIALNSTGGQATITATYASMSSSFTFIASRAPHPQPYLGSNLGSVLGIGDELSTRFTFVSTERSGAVSIDGALVQWSSSDPRVVSVSGSTLRAVAPGIADITLRYNGMQTVYRVTVPPYGRLGVVPR
jgi:hypothetical protein